MIFLSEGCRATLWNWVIAMLVFPVTQDVPPSLDRQTPPSFPSQTLAGVVLTSKAILWSSEWMPPVPLPEEISVQLAPPSVDRHR
jgi:hypothetical protein